MPLVAVNAGYTPGQLVTGEVNAYSTILGCLLSGRSFEEFDFRVDGQPFKFTSVERQRQAVELLYVQYLLRMEAKEGDYYRGLCEEIRDGREDYEAALFEKVAGLDLRLHGLTYEAEDVWDTLEKYADDPHAVIISNPPTYKGAYEKFLNTGDRLTWKQPDYEVFAAKTDIKRMVDYMEGRAALLLVQQQQVARNSASARPVYARHLSGDQVIYLNSNRPDECEKLIGRQIAVPRNMSGAKTEVPYEVIPEDYEINAKSKITVLPVTTAVANVYRRAWMHRLKLVSGGMPVMVFVDGYAAGVIGYSFTTINGSVNSPFSMSMLLQYAFGAPHKTLRLTRFATMVSLQKDTAMLAASDKTRITVAASEGVVTVEFTRYPESKGLRGLMKLHTKAKEKGRYKLSYWTAWDTPMKPRNVWKQFLMKEEQWRKNRAKSLR